MFSTRICFSVTSKYCNPRRQKSKIQEKNEIKIRVSNLVKKKLLHMDAYDGGTTE